MSELDKNIKEKKGRLIAVIIAVSISIWSITQGVAPSFGISAKYMLIIDFFTLTVLSWALFYLYKIIINHRTSKG